MMEIENNEYTRARIINCTKLNVRNLPTKKSKSIYVINSEDTFRITSRAEDWLRITTSNNIIGYVMAEYVEGEQWI